MRALICPQFAPLDKLHPGDLPLPTPGETEVLIRVFAAGMNFYDTLIVQGKYQIKPPLPFSPGGESAGIVEAVGAKVTHLKAGDRVVAFSHYGAFAEYCKAPASQTFPLPDAVSYEQAAAGLVAYGTAWFALHDRGRLKAGETVLVLGAAGAVGRAAVQIAHRAGARVVACAGSEANLELARAAGADACVDYSSGDLKEMFKAAVGFRGADIVIDVLGNPYTEAAVRATGWRGRVLVIGFAAGEIPRIPANLMLLKGSEVAGVLWDGLLEKEPEVAREQAAAILAAFADGSLAPAEPTRFDLEQGREALQALAERRVTGKVIITPN